MNDDLVMAKMKDAQVRLASVGVPVVLTVATDGIGLMLTGASPYTEYRFELWCVDGLWGWEATSSWDTPDGTRYWEGDGIMDRSEFEEDAQYALNKWIMRMVRRLAA